MGPSCGGIRWCATTASPSVSRKYKKDKRLRSTTKSQIKETRTKRSQRDPQRARRKKRSTKSEKKEKRSTKSKKKGHASWPNELYDAQRENRIITSIFIISIIIITVQSSKKAISHRISSAYRYVLFWCENLASVGMVCEFTGQQYTQNRACICSIARTALFFSSVVLAFSCQL